MSSQLSECSQLSKSTTLVATQTTTVAKKHNCHNSNHNCRNLDQPQLSQQPITNVLKKNNIVFVQNYDIKSNSQRSLPHFSPLNYIVLQFWNTLAHHKTSLGIVVVGEGNPHGNLGCKWNENLCGNEGEIFKSGLIWEGGFPKPVNLLIHLRMTSYHHWDIFT